VETIIAAIAVGVVLLWAGVLGLLRLVELYERKHLIGLGAYTTVVAGVVMGLVLFTSDQRQKEHREQLSEQMNDNSKRLNDLADRLRAQLVEKADLTTSEFEVRAKLQNEIANHQSTQQTLEAQKSAYGDLQKVLGGERRSRLQYQDSLNTVQETRFTQEEARYQGLRSFLEVHRTTVGNIQKQLADVQGILGNLRAQTGGLQTQQKNILAQITTNRQGQDALDTKLKALQGQQQKLDRALGQAQTKLDSLYLWQNAP
jgi:chromosome segregation ATPase